MKPLLLILLFIFPFLSSAQNQERYIKYLDAALEAAEKKDSVKVIENLEYFSTAIELENITPEKLKKEVLEIYTAVLYNALVNEVKLPDNIGGKAVPFLKFNIDNKPENMFSLGFLYDGGIGVLQNETHAKYWYERAVEKGSIAALNNIGVMHLKSNDLIKAEDYFLKAAKAENIDAMRNLCIMFTDKDLEKSGFWAFELNKRGYTNPIEENARKGSQTSQMLLAIFYEKGYGYVQNSTEANKTFEKLIKSNYMPALIYLGTENIRKENWEDAKRNFEMIFIKNSHKDAAGYLSYIYYVKKKYKQARKFAEIARDGGNPFGFNVMAQFKCDNAMTLKDQDECMYLQKHAEQLFKGYEPFKDLHQLLKVQPYKISLLSPKKN